MKAYNAVTAVVAGAIGVVSPRGAWRYRVGRESLRSYVAAEITGPNQNWRPRNRSADAEIKRGHKLITARARDLVRNNSYVAGAIEKICNNVVRRGIRPQAQFRVKGQPDRPRNRLIEAHFERWSRYADVSGHNSFAALQRLILRHIWVDGEILLHRVWDNSLKGIAPLRLEVIESDHLDARIDGALSNGNIGRRGVEVDPATNRPVFFHVLDQHPGDDYRLGGQAATSRIPAADIIHVYDKRRASQTRGVSWLAAILMESYDLSEYKAYERIGARLAAAFGIFVKTSYPDGGMGAGIGVPAKQFGPDGELLPSADIEMPDYIEPGRIQKMPYGSEIQVASHNRPGTQYEPFVTDSVRGMSTGSGMSYEAFSNDYTAASYSSARSASLEERLSYQGQQLFLNEKCNARVWAWFLEAAYLAGLLPSSADYAADPLVWHEAVVWQNPGWTWVDPLKDSKAAGEGLTNCTTTRTTISAQLGEDWEDDILATLVHEEEQLSRLYELRAKNQTKQQEDVAHAK